MNLDKAFDIYEEFILKTRTNPHFERARCDDEGNERLYTKFYSGFTVELTNKKNVEDSAALRCWWKDEEAVEVYSLEQLMQEYSN